MKEVYIESTTLPEAFHKGVMELSMHGQLADCSDWNLKGKESYGQRECTMNIHINEPLKEPRISKLTIFGPRELEQYRLEVLDGILDYAVDVMGEKNGVVGPLEDYTYHNRMYYPINQVEFVKNDLKRNKEMSSRRAVIGIRNNEQDTKLDNPACLQNIQFFVREGKLDMCVLFRSNDFANAFFMNAFAFICFQEEIANELGLLVGSYSHRSNSMHVYEKDFAMFDGFAKKIQNEPIETLTYEYKGYFKAFMDEETAGILAQWQEQKMKHGVE